MIPEQEIIEEPTESPLTDEDLQATITTVDNYGEVTITFNKDMQIP